MKIVLNLLIVSALILGTAATPKAAEIIMTDVTAPLVQQAVNDLKNQDGGTLILPTCDVDFERTLIKVPGGIRIIGQGKTETVLRNTVFHFNKDHYGTVGDGLSQLSSMSIINSMTDKMSEFLFRRVAGARLDNVSFVGRFSTFCNVNDVGYLIVDNCDFDLFTSYGFYVFSDNTYLENIGSLDATHILGTTRKGSVYVEDCYFTGRYDHLMDGRSGAHWVFRHNTIVYDEGSGPIEGHGPTIPGDDVNVGTNAIEVYDVDIEQTGSSGSAGILIRSGVAAIHNVSISNKGYGVALAVENSPHTYPRTAADYPVYHQPHGIWIWDMAYENIQQGEVDVVWNSEACIQEDRDYFLRPPSQSEDGFTYTPYEYPHPYRDSLPVPDSEPDPEPEPEPEPTPQDGDTSSGSDSGGGCFIQSMVQSIKPAQLKLPQ